MALFRFYLGESRSITFFPSLSEGRMFGPEARGSRAGGASTCRIKTSVKSQKKNTQHEFLLKSTRTDTEDRLCEPSRPESQRKKLCALRERRANWKAAQSAPFPSPSRVVRRMKHEQ